MEHMYTRMYHVRYVKKDVSNAKMKLPVRYVMSITSYTKVTAIPIVLQEPTQWDVVALYVTIIALNAPVLLNVGNVNQRTIYMVENAIPNVLERHT